MADTYDHVPPLVMVHALGQSHFEACHIKLYLVPACRECNSLLNNNGSTTVMQRKIFIKGRLRKRYAKYLEMGRWEQEELEELGWGLRTVVESGASIKEWVQRRLAW